jgi:carboxyl-terminal processing protease
VSRYDDPRWYEEQHTNPIYPTQPAYDDVDQHTLSPIPSNNVLPHENQAVPTYTEEAENHHRRAVGQIFVLIAFVIIAFGGGWFSHQYFGNTFNTNDQSKAYIQLFQQAWTTVDMNYVDRKNVDYKAMSYAAIQAMVQTLNDKGHTRFMTPEQIKSENQELSGKFTGIGIYLRQDGKTKKLMISSTIPGSPAEKAGLKYRDTIIAVDGASTSGKDVNAVSDLIQGEEGTTTALTIQRPGLEHTLTIKVARALIDIPNVVIYYIAEEQIAHVQIVQFSDNVSQQLRDALQKTKQMGARKIILDLRNNPGGYLNEAVNTASLFMKDGTVLLEQDKTGKRTALSVNGNPLNTTDTMVVLVNERSASAAEIVSGALHEHKRAILIGTKTFGTGTVLQQFTLADGSAILLGTQEWLTPKGQLIRDKGIKPDIEVQLEPNIAPLTPNDEKGGAMTLPQILASGDAQLVAAIKYLSEARKN